MTWLYLSIMKNSLIQAPTIGGIHYFPQDLGSDIKTHAAPPRTPAFQRDKLDASSSEGLELCQVWHSRRKAKILESTANVAYPFGSLGRSNRPRPEYVASDSNFVMQFQASWSRWTLKCRKEEEKGSTCYNPTLPLRFLLPYEFAECHSIASTLHTFRAERGHCRSRSDSMPRRSGGGGKTRVLFYRYHLKIRCLDSLRFLLNLTRPAAYCTIDLWQLSSAK